MRQLLVLILVVIVSGALYLALRAGDESGTGSEGLEGPDGTVAAATKETDETTELVGGSGTDADREVGDTTSPIEVERETVDDPSASLATSLTGRIVDPEGNPLEGAELRLTRFGQMTLFFDDPSKRDRSAEPVEKTDAEGRYLFTGIEPFDQYSLIATHADYARAEVGSIGVVEGERTDHPDIALGEGIRLYGIVSDTGGNMVPSAVLHMGPITLGGTLEDQPDTVRVVSDENGAYEFPHVAAGNYSLVVTGDGYGRLTIGQLNVEGKGDVERNVTLEIAHMIAGRVTSTTGEPVDGAQIVAYAVGGRGASTRAQTKTDENGDFLFEDIVQGNYTLQARADAYDTGQAQKVASGDMTVAIELAPVARVTGVITVKASGQPLRTASARLRRVVPNTDVTSAMTDTLVETDSEGRFSIPCRQPGQYRVEGLAKNFAPCESSSFTMVRGQDMGGVIVEMTKGGSVTGRVVDTKGNPIVGARVTSRDNNYSDDPFMRALGDAMPTKATERTTTTNGKGEFLLSELAPTTYQIAVAHKDFAQTVQQGVIIGEDGESNVRDLVMTVGASIQGNVRGPDGKPRVGAIVTLTRIASQQGEASRQYRAKTDEKGAYSIPHVKAGTYMLQSTGTDRPGADMFAGALNAKETSRKLTLSDGENRKNENISVSE